MTLRPSACLEPSADDAAQGQDSSRSSPSESLPQLPGSGAEILTRKQSSPVAGSGMLVSRASVVVTVEQPDWNVGSVAIATSNSVAPNGSGHSSVCLTVNSSVSTVP